MPVPSAAKAPGLEAIAGQHFAGLKTAIAKIETEGKLQPAPRLYEPITLDRRIGLLYTDCLSPGLRLPTDTELTRLAAVFEENPRYRVAWQTAYEKIVKGDEKRQEPLEMESSKEIGEHLLYAAAALKKAGKMDKLPNPRQFAQADLLSGFKKLRDELGTYQRTVQIETIKARNETAQAFFAKSEDPIDGPLTNFDNERTKRGLEADAKKKIATLEAGQGFINERKVDAFRRELEVNIDVLRGHVRRRAQPI